MKTTEFEKRLKSKGYTTCVGKIFGRMMVIETSTNSPVLIFEPDEVLAGNDSISSLSVCPNNKTQSEISSLISMVVAYLTTPLNERVEQQVKVRVTGKYESGDGTNNLSISMSKNDIDVYVNMDTDDSSYHLDDEYGYSFTSTIFDKSQVKNIMNSHFRDYTYVIEPVGRDNEN